VGLAGKVAIVTGAASGIGDAVTRRFLAEGVAVAAVDRDEKTLEGAVARWRDSLDDEGRILPVIADVAVTDDVERTTAETTEALGDVDILVCNAGVEARGMVTETSRESWDAVLSINLSSVFLCSKFVLPSMIERQGGVIVNVASQLGLVGFPRFAAYNAAKGGVVNLTRNLALDFAAHNIRVNAVCPGPIETPHLARSLSSLPEPERLEAREALKARVPLGRIGRPDDVAGCVAFLASEDATYMTGAMLVVDGGYTAA
jgi:NAD(P)-dependent dehydrogenase (short-subunit alcohol dehydrogenase family)